MFYFLYLLMLALSLYVCVISYLNMSLEEILPLWFSWSTFQGTAPTESYGSAVQLILWVIHTTSSDPRPFSYSCPSGFLRDNGNHLSQSCLGVIPKACLSIVFTMVDSSTWAALECFLLLANCYQIKPHFHSLWWSDVLSTLVPIAYPQKHTSLVPKCHLLAFQGQQFSLLGLQNKLHTHLKLLRIIWHQLLWLH